MAVAHAGPGGPGPAGDSAFESDGAGPARLVGLRVSRCRQRTPSGPPCQYRDSDRPGLQPRG